MLVTAKHENHFTSEGFWNEKWHMNLHCRSKFSRSTPSVNQERDAVLSTLTWTRCLLWLVSKDTSSYLGLNSYLMWCGWGVSWMQNSSSRAGEHKDWVHSRVGVYTELKMDVHMKHRNKMSEGRETENKRLSFFQLTHFFPGLVSASHYPV